MDNKEIRSKLNQAQDLINEVLVDIASKNYGSVDSEVIVTYVEYIDTRVGGIAKLAHISIESASVDRY